MVNIQFWETGLTVGEVAGIISGCIALRSFPPTSTSDFY